MQRALPTTPLPKADYSRLTELRHRSHSNGLIAPSNAKRQGAKVWTIDAMGRQTVFDLAKRTWHETGYQGEFSGKVSASGVVRLRAMIERHESIFQTSAKRQGTNCRANNNNNNNN